MTEKLIGYPILREPDGNYQGKLAFPICVGAIMSNITEAQARDENLYYILEKPQVAYRDELLEWMNFSDRQLIQRSVTLKSECSVISTGAKVERE